MKGWKSGQATLLKHQKKSMTTNITCQKGASVSWGEMITCEKEDVSNSEDVGAQQSQCD